MCSEFCAPAHQHAPRPKTADFGLVSKSTMFSFPSYYLFFPSPFPFPCFRPPSHFPFCPLSVSLFRCPVPVLFPFSVPPSYLPCFRPPFETKKASARTPFSL